MFQLLQRSLKATEVTKISFNRFLSSSHKHNDSLIVEEKDGVRTLLLNNPAKRNALNRNTLELFENNLNDSPSLRVILLKSSGPVFSSGHDLKEMINFSPEERKSVFDLCSRVMIKMREIPVPVIAQVRGLAAAAGCQFAAATDITIASSDSKFSTPGANVGLFCSTPGIALTRSVNPKMSAYMLFSGLPIDAQTALRSGLISHVFSEEEIEEKTNQIIDAILGKSKSIIGLGKSFHYKQLDLSLKEAYSQGSELMASYLKLKDGQEGVSAFFRKSKPNWTHSLDATELN